MRFHRQRILRLSGKLPDPAPEQKSETIEAAAIFRRFFYALERLDLKGRFRRSFHTDREQQP